MSGQRVTDMAEAEMGRSPVYRYPFPLRDGVDVFLALPRDLTGDEAERICEYVRTLARPEAAS